MEIIYKKERSHSFPTALDITAIGISVTIGITLGIMAVKPIVAMGIIFASSVALAATVDEIEKTL